MSDLEKGFLVSDAPGEAGVFPAGSTLHSVRRLTSALSVQARVINEQAAFIARYQKMYESVSALAKIGVWECNLATGVLTWTDAVYDIFELPRGTTVTRQQIFTFYDEASLIKMTAAREKAIEERGSFQIDIRIRTAKGNIRWVRITADVECQDDRPVHIFGLKQDITKEKDATDRMRQMAESDHLTGLGNRGLFQAQLAARLVDGRPDPLAALVLVDLDGFKAINDTFGHVAGDECLKEIAARLKSICRGDELAARIGGDEFAILLAGTRHREPIEARVKQMLASLEPPIIWLDTPLEIGASIGIAIATAAHASCPSELFSEADLALYAAKRSGGNAFRTFEPAAGRLASSRHDPKADPNPAAL